MDVISVILQGTDAQGQAAAIPEPGLLAQRMTVVYRRWDRRQEIDLVALAEELLDHHGHPDDPLTEACLETAAAAVRWGGHEYHSAHHHAEVTTNAMVIAELGRRLGYALDPHARLLLLASALAHDLYFEPTGMRTARFQTELRSARALTAIAERCGVGPADQQAIGCLILATEPDFRATLRALLHGDPPEPELPALLAPIATDPGLADLAAILSDGDLLSSAGLTQRWQHVQTRRLEREMHREIDARDGIAFLDRIVGRGFLSPGGRHFDPNLARLRAALEREVSVHRPAFAAVSVA